VHVDPPAEHKAYLHRSGRTARAGSGGDVVTLMTPDQRADVRLLAKQAGIAPTITAVTAGDAAIASLTGPQADRVVPVPVVETHQPSRAPGKRGPGRAKAAKAGKGASAGRSPKAAPKAGSGAKPGKPGTVSRSSAASISERGTRRGAGPSRHSGR